MDNILVTGGAGYIGSHNCKALFNKQFCPITYDNLSEGNKYAVQWGPFIEADINDSVLLNKTFETHNIKAVMHFAANALVYESMTNPLKYYHNNVTGTINLLKAMLKHGVKYLIFSSSCATYGTPTTIPISEDHRQDPINVYGKTKLMIEQILEDFDKAYNLKYVSLRYFNAAGADLDTQIGEDRKIETHLIPLAIDTSLKKRDSLYVYGTDFDTTDGSAIRDYIHVQDLADAHIKALYYLLENNKSISLNLGTGQGFSVLEVIDAIENFSNKKLKTKLSDKRDGDPDVLYANNELACKILNWKPKYSDLKTIIQSAYKWHQKKSSHR